MYQALYKSFEKKEVMDISSMNCYPGAVELENYGRNQEKKQSYLSHVETKTDKVVEGVPDSGKSVHKNTEIKQYDVS